MKRKQLLRIFTLIIFGFIIVIGSNAQNEWELVYSESDEFIRDICFVEGDDGLWQTGWGITGYPESNIIKTTDGGDTWTEIQQSFSTLLASISFADEDTGYICTLQGSDPAGLVLKSTDGGLTWSEIRNVVDESFDKIRFKDAQNGIVSGYPSLYTTDGGITWTESELPEEYDVYWQVDYAGSDTYFGIELGGEVGTSTDDGANWTQIHSFSPTMLGGIDFHDEMHGIVGGDLSLVSVTHDGGASWESTTLGTGQRFGMAIGAFDKDIMYAGLDMQEIWMTSDGGETWEMDTLLTDHTYRSMVVTPYNVVYIGGNNLTDGGGTVWRKVGELPLYAVFETSENEACAGSTIDFTDQSYYDVVSWDWTFEGGTPSSSTDQNPTVTYNNGGVYDVTLTVTNSNGESQTLTEIDFIEIFEVPEQADTPTGEAQICTSNTYIYTIPEIEFAMSYDWEISPTEAGSLTWTENEALLETTEDWIGDFTIRVRAGNFCDDGDWSEYLSGSIYLSPESFILEGGGSFCEGGEGVEITLSGSQIDIDYQLYLDGEATGNAIPGTGDAISFGYQAEAGLYEATGSNENCETYMSEQIAVIVLESPTPEIEGLDMVCDDDITEYETVFNENHAYLWEVTGGEINDGQGTQIISVQWGESGTGYITLTETDENECVSSTEPFEVMIDDCTGVDEITSNELITFYPNPASDLVHISAQLSVNTQCTINIYSVTGQNYISEVIKYQVGQNNHQINISHLPVGLYLIVIRDENQVLLKNRLLKK